MKTISLIHPSRSRAEQAKRTADSWLKHSSGVVPVEYILSIDNSDPQKEKYIELFSCQIVCSDNTCVVEAANAGAKQSTGNYLVLVSDDFECPQNWDLMIADAFTGKEGYVLKTFDGVQKWIVTLAIMDRAYYKACGYFYHPSYRHMFVDTDMTHKADLEGRLLFRNDLHFRHAHYSTGGMKKDAVNEKADATWAHGESVYLARVALKFGLKVPDVFAVSDLGQPHINWLKKKLNQ